MKKPIQLCILILISAFIASCEKIDMTEMDSGEANGSSSSSAKTLIIRTRSADASSLPLPITLYALDSNGKCKAQTTIKEGVNREEPSFSLSRGQYSIIAMHTPASYPAQASNVESSTMINLPTENYATEQLYLGTAEVNLTSNNQSVEVTMNLKQAKMNISLTEVPTNVSSLSVTISSIYTKLTLSGNHSDAKDVTIPCSKIGDKWTSGDVYILPSSASATTFTFNMKDAEGKISSYAYTYNGSITAGTPYNFVGKYSDEDIPDQLALYSNITIGKWNSAVTKSFSFGPGADQENENPSVPTTDFPTDGDIWKGHVVALADMIDDNSCNLMLISLDEWDNVYSANSEDNYEDAVTLAEEYKEDGVNGWRMPTSEEAKRLKDVYARESNFTYLNKQIEACEGIPLSLTDGSSNARYLCENATCAFGFKSGSTISTAGAKTLYHLRLIKNITITKQ